jgi:PAS domain S-box-containing protein
MVIVAATFWFIPQAHRAVIGIFLAIAVIYNLILLVGVRRRVALLMSRSLILGVDSALALVLVMYTGGEASPYLLVLVFMMISGAYWYGAWTAIIIGVAQTLLLVIQHLVQNQALVLPKTLIIRMLILIAVGVYVSLLTKSERQERNQLITLGTETEKERQQLLALVNNMRDAVLVVDNSQNIIIYNSAAATWAGRDQKLPGQPINSVIRFEDDNSHLVKLNVRQTEAAFERKDLHMRAPDNSLVNVAVSVVPYIVDRQNRGHIVIIRDITQDKTIEQEREEFIAVASHELRTPLTIAQGDISLLLAPPYLPENRESVDMLNGALRSLQQLSNIIKDLTNLSQVENEKLDVQLEPLKPIDLLREFQSDYHDQAKTEGLKLNVKIDPALSSATILTSRYVVREILSVFVTNALKFTDKGTVTLAVMNPEDKAPGVTFAITDTGLGISQSDQKKLFEKFFQSEKYTTRVHGGTGLGLHIAKQLAARITAKLWFDTELGKGSTFYLWVPPYSKHAKDSGKVAAAETKDFFSTV